MAQKKALKKSKSSFSQDSVKDIRWDLSDLYASLSDKKIDKVLTSTHDLSQAFAKKHYGKLKNYSSKKLMAVIEEKTELILPFYELSQYVHLEFATDTHSSLAKSRVLQVEEMGAKIQNLLLFFELELGQLDSKKAKQLINASDLTTFSYSLSQIQKKAHHKLSEPEEQLINIKDLTGSQAFQKLYSELTSAFKFKLKLKGQEKVLNGSELRALRQDPSATVRRTAMSLFFKTYEERQLVLSSIYNNVVKDYVLEANQRGYGSSIEVMNKSHDLSNETVDLLHRVTEKSYPIVQDYYTLKKSLLKLKKFTLSDIYAPLPEATKTFSWAEAVSLIQASFAAFDPEFRDIADQMFDRNRIDVPVTPTKRGGAFCSSSTPRHYPFVMLNYLGRPRDISTLAHELGHAIHSVFSQGQPLWNFHAILPLCETASVFCEMVLRDYLLKNETNKAVKISLLCDFLEDTFATSHRQNMFSSFERKAHEEIAKGWVPASQLCELYEEELQKMFGGSVDYTQEYRWEWSSIPHIVEVPFYVYSYNFGNLLVLALYQQYLSEGPSFVPKLKKVLSMGSSASPIDITKAVGVDIQSPKFWQQSISYIESKVTELKSLL